jgi:hypothetical protein
MIDIVLKFVKANAVILVMALLALILAMTINAKSIIFGKTIGVTINQEVLSPRR